MRVIAQDHDWFVLEVEPNVGRVFDLPRRRLFAPMSLVAIMARGAWRDFVGDPEYVFDALSDAEDVPSDQLSLTRQGFSEWDLALRTGTASGVVARDRPYLAQATTTRQPERTTQIPAGLQDSSALLGRSASSARPWASGFTDRIRHLCANERPGPRTRPSGRFCRQRVRIRRDSPNGAD